MSKVINLVELYTHSEVLRTFCILLTDAGFHVKVFTNLAVWNNLQDIQGNEKIIWQLQQSNENIPTFILRNKKLIDSEDLTIFTTLVSSLSFFSSLTFKTKTLLIIHNGNTFFEPYKNLKLSNRFPEISIDFARMLKFFILRQAYKRSQLLQQFNFLCLPSQTVEDFILNRNTRLEQKYSFVGPLPFVYFEGNSQEKIQESTCIKIAIPGTVSDERKDYNIVLAAFQQLEYKSDQKIKLILLGNAGSKEGQELVAKFKILENENFELIYFKSAISQKEFDRQFLHIDFLILPIRQSYKLGIISERYGYTNISGGINDMIRFGIPTLINSHYPLEPNIEKLTASFSSKEELISMIQQWIQKKTYLKLKEDAPTFLEHYKKEAMVKKMERLINGILSD